jgi:BlaI family transcriptional regulator, penicillinase repressor
MKELTKAEEQIMHILWDLERGFVKDIIDRLPDPKPAYNTVSTIVRILEKKGFIDHKAYGKTYEYFPSITKAVYTRQYLNNFVRNYFDDSYQEMVSFFTKKENLTLGELEDLLQIIRQKIKTEKDKDG